MLDQENDLSLASGFEHSSKNKDLCEENLGADSGFLSGPQEFDSGLDLPQSKEQPDHQKIATDTMMDSGAIVDSQIVSGLNNLSLDPPKHFFTSKSNESHKEASEISWEKLYRQDNDGDT